MTKFLSQYLRLYISHLSKLLFYVFFIFLEMNLRDVDFLSHFCSTWHNNINKVFFFYKICIWIQRFSLLEITFKEFLLQFIFHFVYNNLWKNISIFFNLKLKKKKTIGKEGRMLFLLMKLSPNYFYYFWILQTKHSNKKCYILDFETF